MSRSEVTGVKVKGARARQNFVTMAGGLMSTSSCIFLGGREKAVMPLLREYLEHG